MSRIKPGEGWSIVIFILTIAAGLAFNSCNTKDPKFKQYLVEGERLYLKNCSNCHQSSGQGLGLVYPPLATSDFMEDHFETVICSMKHGLNGNIVVNGQSYNQPMPGIPSLTELEIAEIATYIYNTWGHKRGIIEVKNMGSVLERCKLVNGNK